MKSANDFIAQGRSTLLKELKAKVNRLENKTRFIGEVLEETLVLRNAAKDDVVAILHSRHYDELSLKENGEGEKSFAYLLSMSLLSLTKEKVEQLKKEFEQIRARKTKFPVRNTVESD